MVINLQNQIIMLRRRRDFFFNKSGYCEFSTPNLSNPDTEQLDPAIIRGHFHLLDPPI